MNKTYIISLLSDASVDANTRIANALVELNKEPVGNVHLLAKMFGVDKLTDIAPNSTMPFATMYMLYNDIRPKSKDEKADNFKSLPQQMWRDQGIKYELVTIENVATFRFLSYDEAKHIAFRDKNKAQKLKEKEAALKTA